SLARVLAEAEEITAYSLRNPDFEILKPGLSIAQVTDAVIELIRPVGSPQQLALVQFTRQQAMDYAYTSFEKAMHTYLERFEPSTKTFQVALSSGGDARVLAECVRRWL